MSRTLVTLVLILGASSLVASPLGLLDQPQTFPWSAGLTPVVLEEAGGLEAGAFRLRTSALWFNTYRRYGLGPTFSQLVDMEGVLGTASGSWSPAAGWELRGQVQGWSLGGGVMDRALAAFHGLIGVPNQGRDNSGSDEYRNYLSGSFDDTSPAAGLTQASLGVRWFSGAWSWNGWVKPPVPGHLGWGWSDRWGTGAGVGWGDRWPWPEGGFLFRAGGTGALVWVANDPGFPGNPGGLTGQGGGYGIVELNSGPRFLVQASWTAVPRSGTWYLSQAAGLLSLGGQFPLSREWTLETGFCEEFLTWATMEVGFQAGLVTSF